MRSPIPNVGSIDPDGMKKVWTTKARSSTATITATITTMMPSRSQRDGLSLWASLVWSGGCAGGVAPVSGPPAAGSSTTSAGS